MQIVICCGVNLHWRSAFFMSFIFCFIFTQIKKSMQIRVYSFEQFNKNKRKTKLWNNLANLVYLFLFCCNIHGTHYFYIIFSNTPGYSRIVKISFRNRWSWKLYSISNDSKGFCVILSDGTNQTLAE